MKFIARLSLALLANVVCAEDKPAAAKPAETPPAATDAIDAAKLDLLKPKIGQPVTVEGRIVRTGENKTATFRYLNFTENYHSSVSLVVNVAKDSVGFSAEKVKAWVGKKVRATGTLKAFNGDLQIEIDKWEQVKEVPEVPAP